MLLISACIFADVVKSNHKSTQADVERVIAAYLRYAPDRKGGYRRNKEENGRCTQTYIKTSACSLDLVNPDNLIPTPTTENTILSIEISIAVDSEI